MRPLIPLLASGLLCACATHGELSAFPKNSLHQLLAGEFARARGEHEQAMERYLQQAQQTGDAEIARQAAQLAYSLGHDDEAQSALRIWLAAATTAGEDSPAQAHMMLGQLLLARGEAQAGQQQLEQALAAGAHPNFAQLARQLRIGSTHGRRATAQALSQLVLPDDSQELLEASRRHGLALMLEADGQLEAALTQFDRARAVYARDAGSRLQDGWWLRDEARLLTRLERGTEQLRRQRQLVAANPELPNLRWRLIGQLRHRHQLQAALAELRDWLRQHPLDPVLLLQASLLCLQLGQLDTAGEYLGQLHEIAGYRTVALRYLAQLSAGRGDTEEAAAQRRQAAAAAVPMPGLRQLVPLLERDEDIAEYRALAQQLRAARPELAVRLYAQEAQLLNHKGRWRQSAALLDNAVTQFPQNSHFAYMRALAVIEGGEAIDGIAQLRTLLAQSPENTSLQNALGYSLADEGLALEEALRLIQSALRQQPVEAAFIDSLGWTLYRLGRMDEAQRHLERALRLSLHQWQDDAEITAHLGELLWVQGRREDALELWQRALALAPEHQLLRRTMERLHGAVGDS